MAFLNDEWMDHLYHLRERGMLSPFEKGLLDMYEPYWHLQDLADQLFRTHEAVMQFRRRPAWWWMPATQYMEEAGGRRYRDWLRAAERAYREILDEEIRRLGLRCPNDFEEEPWDPPKRKPGSTPTHHVNFYTLSEIREEKIVA